MMPRSGTAAFIALTACGIRPFGFNASEAQSDLYFGFIFGNKAIAGIPKSYAFFASDTTSSRFTRSTPGIDGTGVLFSFASVIIIVQMRSSRIITFSLTNLRDQPETLVLRNLVNGYVDTKKTSLY